MGYFFFFFLTHCRNATLVVASPIWKIMKTHPLCLLPFFSVSLSLTQNTLGSRRHFKVVPCVNNKEVYKRQGKREASLLLFFLLRHYRTSNVFQREGEEAQCAFHSIRPARDFYDGPSNHIALKIREPRAPAPDAPAVQLGALGRCICIEICIEIGEIQRGGEWSSISVCVFH